MKAASKIIWVILDSLFLIVFNVCFFVLTTNKEWFPDGRTNVIWLNYGCIHFAYLLLLLSPLLSPRNVAKDTLPSTIMVVFRFWWIELIAGCVLIGIQIPFMYNVIVQVLLCSIYIGRICIMALANQDTSEKVARHEQELQYVKISEAQLRYMLSSISDKATLRKVEQVYDYIRTSPLRSHPQVHSIEQQVIDKVSMLSMLDDKEQIASLADEIMRLAKQRNQQLLILQEKL